MLDLIIATLRIGNSVLLACNNRYSWPVSLLVSIVKIGVLYQGGLGVLASGKIINLLICLGAWCHWTRQDARQRSAPSCLLHFKHSSQIVCVIMLLAIVFVMQQQWSHLEGVIAALSTCAYIMTAMRKKECWTLWILYDLLLITLYWEKAWHLSAITTVIYLPIGFYGHRTWQKASVKTH